MKAKILVRKHIKAGDAQSAMRVVKKKYPRAKLITYKYDKDFRYVEKDERKYSNRTITVVFVDDTENVWVG